MTDAELIARLQNSKGWPTLGNAAADRIEQLVATNEDLSISNATLIAERATCEKYRDAYAEMGRIGTQAVRDLEAKLFKTEAKLAKTVELLREIEEHLERISGFFFDTFPRKEIKATLAEIKGESHE